MNLTRLALALLGFFSLPSIAWSQTVRIESGLVQGVREASLSVYRSIPFAAPPVGDLRWKSPQPPQRWTGVRVADKFGPVCMQSGVSVPGASAEPISEDCLTLNIWSPTDGKKLPVMVWIPGGGFTQESASMPLYWGDALARRGVLVVTINYRVGVFGFLAHPQLTKESRHQSSGNYGILDQIAALKWIQRNIAAFGGDPDSVTIWGQSAGAMSVNLLMASPLANDLFRRAIGESGGFFTPVATTREPASYFLSGAEERGLKFEAAAGVTSITALRQLSAEQILKVTGVGTTHPIIDGYVLRDEPFDVFSKRRQNDVPILIGSNADEARPLLRTRTFRATSFYEDLVNTFPSDAVRDLVRRYLRAYPVTNDTEARETRAQFERDLRFGWDMWAWARLQATYGKSKVFYYHFQHSPPIPEGSPFSDWRAGHWQELRYVFDHLNQESWPWTDADRGLAETMAAYWTNFAKKGDPNGTGLSIWPAFTIKDPRVILFDSRVSLGNVPNLESLQLFEDVYLGIRGKGEFR